MQNLSRFFDAQSPEESELYDFALPLINCCQRMQCFIYRYQIDIGFVTYRRSLFQRNVRNGAAAFQITARASEIDKNAPHQIG